MKIRIQSLLVFALVLALLMFAGGAGTGYAIQRNIQDRHSAGLVSLLTPRNAPRQSAVELNVLEEAIAILEEDYFSELPPPDVLNRAAIRGVLEELGDPYTILLDPEMASMQQEDIQGEFGGIGAHVEWDEGTQAVRIVEPFVDSPAAMAGLQRGDYIVEVDGLPVSDLGLSGTVAKVRGPTGTEVALTIVRGEERWDVSITRRLVEIQVVEKDWLGVDESVGYLKLTTFNAKSADAVERALEELLASDIEALIFDLRDNGGGLLDQSVTIAGLFLGRKMVTEQRDEDGRITEHRGNQRPMVPPEVVVAVLVNASSASASEVVAGALQDHARGYLIGEGTFGKGSVQRTSVLADASQLRVTVSRWYTPAGRSIEDGGLEPDLAIPMNLEDYADNQDPQLDAALDYLSTLAGHDGQS